MKRFKGLAAVIGLLLVEFVAWKALRAAGSVEQWRVDWSDLPRWIDSVPPADVAIGLLCWVGMVIVGYLAITTSLYVMATVSRVPRLLSWAGLFTVPGIRRLVEGGLAVGLIVSPALSRAPAFAHETTAPVTREWVSPAAAAALPPEAVDAAVVVTPTLDTQGRIVTVAGDNYWDQAASALAQVKGVPVNELRNSEVTAYWSEMITASQAAGGNSSGDPNLIFPGEVQVFPAVAGFADVVVTPAGAVTAPVTAVTPPAAVTAPPVVTPAPADPAPVTTVATTPPTSVATATTAPATTVAAAQEAVGGRTITTGDTDAAGTDTTAVTAAPRSAAANRASTVKGGSAVLTATYWAGGGLLFGGVLLSIREARRRNNRRRLAGQVPVPGGAELDEIEMETHFAADAEGLEFVDAAIRALGALVDTPPELVGFVLGPDQLDLVLAEDAVAPLPFRGRGTHWRIARSEDLDVLRRQAGARPMPIPAVVTLGRNAEGDEVVVNLEDPGLISIVGDGALDIVNAAALQLATEPWSPLVEVILVGFETAAAGPTVRCVASLADVMDELEAEGLRKAELLVEAGCSSASEARLREVADETWIPTVVVCASSPPDHLARRLVGVVASAEVAGVSALVAGHVADSPWELAVSEGQIVVDGFGTTVVTPQRMGDGQYVLMRDLLDNAAAAPIAGPDEEPVPVEPATLIVDLFGPIGVDGLAEPFSRGKAREIFVYLACHRGDHIDGDRLMGVMWPDGDPQSTRNTLGTTLFYARQAVGKHRIPPYNGKYQAVDVVTSVELLQQALHDARDSTEATREALRLALTRVRGRPFDEPTRAGHGGGRAQTAWEWAHYEHKVSNAARIAVDAAHRLVMMAIESGDLELAGWAVHQGLIADPDSEQLRGDEMRVAAAKGDLAALDASMSAVNAAAFAAGDEPSGVIEAVYHSERDRLVS